MGMTPTEALRAVTETGAAALRRDDIGRLTVGSRADFAVLDAPSHLHLAYRPGVPLVSETWVGGRRICHQSSGVGSARLSVRSSGQLPAVRCGLWCRWPHCPE